jgi:parallel beta-helix repeat protein
MSLKQDFIAFGVIMVLVGLLAFRGSIFTPTAAVTAATVIGPTKIVDDPAFDVHFVSNTIVGSELVVKFYHDSAVAQPVWIEQFEPLTYSLSSPVAQPSQQILLYVSLIDGRVPRFRLHVGATSEVFEFGGGGGLHITGAATGGGRVGAQSNGGTWWNTSWAYKKSITVNTSTNVNDYQILLNVSFESGKMNSDFSDIRFVNSAENAELSYWIENYSASSYADVWVKGNFTTANGTQVYMYYGNPGAGSASNADNTFVVYDNFSSQDTNKWTFYNGASVTGGELYLNVGTAYAETAGKKNWTGESVLEMQMRQGVSSDRDGEMAALDADSAQIRCGDTPYFGGFHTYSDGKYGTGEVRTNDITVDSRYYRMRLSGTSDNCIRQNSLTDTGNYQTVSKTLSTSVNSYSYYLRLYSGGGSPTGVWIDWARVRKYTSPEPAASFGGEENITVISSCQTISVAGDYVLNQSIIGGSAPCITISSENVTLDCKGLSITESSPTGPGIYVYGMNNATIKNCIVSNFNVGLFFNGGNNSNAINNTLYSNGAGILLYYSSNNLVENSNASNNNGTSPLGLGIALPYSNNNTIKNNSFNSNSRIGIGTSGGSDNIFTNNSATNNGEWDFFSNDSALDNIVINLTTQENLVSFTSQDIALKGLTTAEVPTDPSSYSNIDKSINATNNSATSWLFINFSYSDSDWNTTNITDESTLSVWRYNGTWAQSGWNGTRVLDTANNIVGVNITEFGSTFAPLGQLPDNPPNVTLVSPADSTNIYSTTTTVTCNATDDSALENITLYVWNSTAEFYTNTTIIGGMHNSSSWNLTNLTQENYTWNCLAYNNASQSDWADSNRTFTFAFCPAGMSGSNTIDDPCRITTCEQLQAMNESLAGYYALGNNIDCINTSLGASIWDSKGFSPIGSAGYCGNPSPGCQDILFCSLVPCSSTWYTNYFAGSLDGSNYTISNLSINRSSQNFVGLFGYVATGSNITNVTLKDVNVSGNRNTGGLVGYSSGTINFSNSIGSVIVIGSYGGGLVGMNYGSITASSSRVDVIATTWYYKGGLVGYNGGTIESSSATGDVTGVDYSGGLAGSNSGSIDSSYATGDVTGTGNSGNTGGLVGINEVSGSITASYATGDVTGTSNTGGFAGVNNGGTISSSYATGDVTATDINTGGFTGANGGTITFSYSIGNVLGITYVGGFTGSNFFSIDSSYSTGSISGSSTVGGFAGRTDTQFGSLTNSGWWTGSAVNATGDPAAQYITYNEADKSVFFNTAGTHAIYSSWSFPPWDNTSCDDIGYPPLEWQNVTDPAECSGYTPPPAVFALSPPNNAVDTDGNAYFNCSAATNTALANISLYFAGALNQTAVVSGASATANFSLLGLANGNYNWSCGAYDAAGNPNSTSVRFLTVNTAAAPSSSFSGTNWSAVPDITNVNQPILENASAGKIQWIGSSINASGADFNAYVTITSNSVRVNTSALGSSFNTSANITLYGLNCTNLPVPIWDPEDDWTFDVCPSDVCTAISCIDGNFTFNTAHFTTFSSGDNVTSCGTLTTDGYYVLTTNINGSSSAICITINANDVELDCQNYTIYGNDSSDTYGIVSNNYDNITVKNCTIKDFTYGVYFENNADAGTILNNTLISNVIGIGLSSSSNNNITNNTISSNTLYGIWLNNNANNTIANNIINSNTQYGIRTANSDNNSFTSNTINSNDFGLGIITSSDNNTVINNTINSNNQYGIYLSDNSADNIFINNNATNNTVSDFRSEGSSFGNIVTNLTTQQNLISFTFNAISLKGLLANQAPSGLANYEKISKYINATGFGGGSWVFLNFSYSDSDWNTTNITDESTLSVWRYNGTWAQSGWNGTRVLDTANNIVGVNITEFGSTFAPMGSAPVTVGNLSCTVRYGTSGVCLSGETGMLHMSNSTNAHTELPNQSIYNYTVCCNDTAGANTVSNSTGYNFLRLSNETNAHAEQSNYANYLSLAYIGGSVNGMSCNYRPVSGDCSATNETCLLTLSNTTNAHVGDCTTNPYNLTVCCAFTTFPPCTLAAIDNDTDSLGPDGLMWDAVNDSNATANLTCDRAPVSCRWDESDINYDSMSSANNCTISGSNISCSFGDLAEGVYTRYVACADADNKQDANSNANVGFGVDFTGPRSVFENLFTGIWQRTTFTANVRDSDPDYLSEVRMCYWSFKDLSTLANGTATRFTDENTDTLNYNDTNTFPIVVGPIANCTSQGANICNITAWCVDWAGNVGT